MRLCSIASGSSGNCIYVGTEQTHVLVDVGLSGKKIEQGLNNLDIQGKEIDGILITHEHSDHIQGLGVMARRYGIPIYTAQGTAQAILQTKSVGKIPDELFRVVKADQPFKIKDLEVKAFTISHDAAEPIAFRFENNNKAIGIATDLGIYTEYIIENLKNLDALLLESNHDIRMLQVGSYPYYLKQRILGNKGHLSNENAGKLLCELLHDDMKHVFLGHLSKENNYEELAYETVCAEITMGENPYKANDFRIQIANRDENSEIIAV